MATLITEKMRNPINNSWIPLRQIEGDAENGITAIKQLGVDGNTLNIQGPLSIVDGQFATEDIPTVFRNLTLETRLDRQELFWDGSFDIQSEDFPYYKLSDKVFNSEDFISSTIILTNRETGDSFEYTVDKDSIFLVGETPFRAFMIYPTEHGFLCLSVFEETKVNMKTLSPGLYLDVNDSTYVSKIIFDNFLLSLESGGTGANNAAEARKNLGLEIYTGSTPPSDETSYNFWIVTEETEQA